MIKKTSENTNENTNLSRLDEVNTIASSSEVSIVGNGAEALIPIEERGMEAITEDKYANAASLGFFAGNVGMGFVTIENGLSFYASIHVNKEHRIEFEFRQRFSNGDLSPMITVRKSDLDLALNGNFKAENIPLPKLRNRLNTFLANIVTDFWDKGMDYSVPTIYRILQLLYCVQDRLPVYSDCDEKSDRLDFYKSIVDAIHGRGRFQSVTLAYSAKAYYPLTSEEMDFVAHQFKLSATELARKLDRFGFLYKTASSTGYQVKIRICSDEQAKDMGISAYDNCYCVLKLEPVFISV